MHGHQYLLESVFFVIPYALLQLVYTCIHFDCYVDSIDMKALKCPIQLFVDGGMDKRPSIYNHVQKDAHPICMLCW